MTDKLRVIINEIRSALREDLITVYAAGASLYIIIASIPFVMLLLSLMQLVVSKDVINLQELLRPFIPSGLHSISEVAIAKLFERSGSIISISAITSLWTASRGVAAISRGVRRVYNINAPTFIYGVLKDSLNTILLILILILSLIVLAFGTAIAGFISGHFVISRILIGLFILLRVIVFMLVLTLTFTLIYRMISGRDMPFKKHIPGAAFSALGWVSFSLGYEFYIENFSNYSYIYGSLTAVVLLMLWLYFGMIIFLFGAKLNILLHERKKIL